MSPHGGCDLKSDSKFEKLIKWERIMISRLFSYQVIDSIQMNPASRWQKHLLEIQGKIAEMDTFAC